MYSYGWFQSTRPRGARRGLDSISAKEALFQSTRPRGARRVEVKYLCPIHCVSIHAPAWGATVAVATAFPSNVFQSTRPRGARLLHFILPLHICGFNPRARVGRDRRQSI